MTPSLRMAGYLPATIDSVLSQDYPHVDYLVMDGGSDDGTRELLEGYGDRLRWVSERDGGQAAAVNRGFQRTEGELFAFLNADDTYRPGAVRRAVEAFQANPGAGAIYGEADYVDASGRVVRPYPTEPFDRERLANVCFICQPATFVSRRAWAACQGLDERLHFALDYDLWIRMSDRFPLVHLEAPIATSRMHPENKTLGSRGEHYRETIGVLKRHFGYVPMSWIVQYAAHRVDRVDQFYVPSRHGLRSRVLALALGLRHNVRQPRRMLEAWSADGFSDLYEDAWMSKALSVRREVPAEAERLVVDGQHYAQVRRPLVLKVRIEGRTIGRRVVRERGPFTLELPFPEGVRGREAEVELRSLWTWRPHLNGDERRLSCFIHSIEFV